MVCADFPAALQVARAWTSHVTFSERGETRADWRIGEIALRGATRFVVSGRGERQA